jgi:photosynthetic reaction center H subunit
MKGEITGYIDVAQVVLYAFWVFFFGLIFYLRREDKREGYPLVADRREHAPVLNFPPIPSPKTFLLADGGTARAPSGRVDPTDIKAVPVAGWPGAPLVPTGNGLLDAVGPGSSALRAETPDMTLEGHPRIVPLRVDPKFTVATADPDPRGMNVVGADRLVAGKVTDVWVDRSEFLIRYLELELAAGGEARSVLLPMNFALVDRRRRVVNVDALLAAQFADVPRIAAPDRITRREEDRVMAYYGGGTLYATLGRAEPLL